MVSARNRALLVAAGALVLAACGGGTLQVNVQLLTQSCPDANGQTVSALDSVDVIEVEISGDGIDEPLTSVAAVGAGEIEIPAMPLGAPGQVARRLIQVRGRFNGPTGEVIARGGARIEVSTDTKGPVTVPIFVRPVDSFFYTSPSDGSGSCAQMERSRAAHTATLLNDGRVLVVGGADFDAVGGRTVQDSAEIFDPTTGRFSLLTKGQGGPTVPRAYHTASLLQDGRVIVVGGENDTDGVRSVLLPSEIFDPGTGKFSTGPILKQARTRHMAATLDGSVVVVAGGYGGYPAGSDPIPMKSTEYWDAAGTAQNFAPGPDLPEARAEGCGVVTHGASDIFVVAGGLTADAQGNVGVSDSIHLLQASAGSLRLFPASEGSSSPLSYQMPVGRYGMGCSVAKVPSATGAPKEVVVLAGGYSVPKDFSGNSAHAGVDVLDYSAGGVSEMGTLGNGGRGNLCAVAVDDHTVVFIGGHNSEDTAVSTGAERLSTASGTVTVDKSSHRMNDSRFRQTCTRLADGSVLVTGGMTESGGSLKTAELYTPLFRN